MTRQKDEEQTGSSMYNIGDMANDPVVDFDTFLDDNESIIDEVVLISTTTVTIMFHSKYT